MVQSINQSNSCDHSRSSHKHIFKLKSLTNKHIVFQFHDAVVTHVQECQAGDEPEGAIVDTGDAIVADVDFGEMWIGRGEEVGMNLLEQIPAQVQGLQGRKGKGGGRNRVQDVARKVQRL